MLKNNLKDIANIVLLRSDKILYELLNNSQHKINKESSAYLHGMQDFYPNSFRKGAIKQSIEYTQNEKFKLDYDFSFLEKLFDEYMEIDGSHIYAKNEVLEKYSSLISKVHPFNLIGYKLAKLYNTKLLSFKNIFEFTKYITPLALNTNRDFKEYADNHIHLGGSNDVSLNFFALLTQKTPPSFYTKELFNSLPRINEFSYINNFQMSFGGLIDIAKYCVSVLNSYLICNKHNNNILQEIEILYKHEKKSLVNIDFFSFSDVSSAMENGLKLNDKILHEFYKQLNAKYTDKAWLLYNVILFSAFEESKKPIIKKVIKVFLHITNILRSYMVMSQNLGLSNFVDFFNSKVRKLEKNKHQNIASNIIANGTTKVEAKITTDAIFEDEFVTYKLAFDKEIIKKESDSIKSQYEKYFLDTNTSHHNYHFCVHLIRKDDKVEKTDICLKSVRFSQLRDNLKDEAKKLSNYLYNKSNIVNKFDFYQKFYDDTTKVQQYQKELEKSYIDMSKLITSIDVAGDENKTPPEVFAPVIKYLRRDIKKHDKFIDEYKKHKYDGYNFLEHHRLRISVHAGEDFNHIATGMRKVHESVKFYDMQKRDRLGHALAIGLNPKEWCGLNGDIFVTKLEHLDNLVWLYHQAIEIEPYFSQATRLMFKYEKVALELSKEIYSESYSIDDLYKAWKLREYCPKDSFRRLSKADEYLSSIACNKADDIYKVAKDINREYHESTKAYEKGEEVVKIEYYNSERKLYKYCITDEDLELLEAIQDRLIQKFCDRGIIIEANPSSNVFIAQINSYDQHPVFRWNPIEDKDLQNKAQFNKYGIRSSRMKVCINTDDPAVMPTTLRNEFALLKKIAFDKKLSDNQENIDNWSEKMRRLGLEIFDFDHKKYEFMIHK